MVILHKDIFILSYVFEFFKEFNGCYIFEDVFLDNKAQILYNKRKKESSLWYGIFLADIFVCISTGGAAYLFCYTAKGEEPCAFSRQPFLLRVGRTDLCTPHVRIADNCIFIWHWNWKVASRKTETCKVLHGFVGVCQSFFFVLF